MADRSVVIIGLPASGKTTYLAALWHLVTAREIDTTLQFGDLRVGDFAHLNAIAAHWRNAIVQERTAVAGKRLVSMNLLDGANQGVRVTFPDVPGEAYRGMWEDRDCEREIADILRTGDVLLLVHADTIRAPKWIVDEVALSKAAGLEGPDGHGEPWNPRHAPTQVQLVDLRATCKTPRIRPGCRRLSVAVRMNHTVRCEAGGQMLRQSVCGPHLGWNPETMRPPAGCTDTPVRCLAASRARIRHPAIRGQTRSAQFSMRSNWSTVSATIPNIRWHSTLA